MLTARDIMSESLQTISPEATVQEAIETLLRKKISGLPVVDANGQMVGVITEFALLAMAYDVNVRQEQVRKHMSTEVISVHPDDPIRKVADTCIIRRVRRVPVVEDGRLVGLIARRDVLKGIYENTLQACVI
jgi:CBS-domain-containing membrane protein